jgi:hypothetical protein
VRQRQRRAIDPAFLVGAAVAAACCAVWLSPVQSLVSLVHHFTSYRADSRVLHRLAGTGAALTFAYAAVGWLLSRGLSPNSVRADVSPRVPVHSVEALAVTAVVGIGLALRLHGLAREFSFDELYSAYWFITRQGSWWDTATNFRFFNNHILFSLLGRLAWLTIGHGVRAGGPSEWVIRLPALVCGLATVYLVWRCGRDWVGREAAVLAALFLAILPLHVEESQSARGYTGLAVCGLLSSWALFRLLERPSRIALITVVVSGAAAIYFHLYGVWIWGVQVTVVAAVAVSAVASHRKPHIDRPSFVQAWLALFGVGVVSMVLYLPVIVQILKTFHGRGHSDPNPALALVVAHELFGAGGLSLVVVLMLIATGVLIGPLRRGRLIGYFVGVMVLPFAVMWRIVHPTDLYGRYFSYWLPYAMLMLASGLLVVWRASPNAPRVVRMGRAIAAASLAVVLGAAWVRQSVAPVSGVEAYRGALAALDDRAPRDMRVCAFGGDADLFTYYQSGLQVMHSEAEFEEFSAGATSFGCVYYNLDWSLPWEKTLATTLAATSEMREFGDIWVFRSRSPRQMRGGGAQ